ncbi:peptide chain release factor N(5)-glutamine methyltransferase [Auraticoccus sp. F435]|uniref:Release factor glutamine methyltransferase n=1 Tax=Auraticoccus cholistanensis TaxID=2656650 RepID=A0A6A9UWK5_9ACTN|nr:peptide chain release factor N(5)-glutamine methyltransferase [Auraticoccus cholistanensis]
MSPASSLQQQLREAAGRLAAAGVAAPAAEARILAGHLLQVEPAALLTAPAMTPEQEQQLAELVRRRVAGAPVQHLTGEAWFRHVRLQVGPGVFVPRPETEVLVGWVLQQLSGLERPLVVDLCTGSGAIARAVADEAPHAVVHAVELSEDALVWAEQNLAGTTVQLHAGDMADALPELDGTVDVVVANPPYIPLSAWESVAPDVRDHDPHLALFSGADGLDAMRVLARTAARLLRPGGLVAAEHAEVQEEAVVQLFVDHGGWDAVRDHRDLNDRSRFVTAVRR